MNQAAPMSFHRGKDRILGGVCSGLAEGLHVDALWVRLGFVLLAFLQGVGLLIYIILWLVMPEQVEGQNRSGFDSMTADLRRIGSELRGQFGGTSKSSSQQDAAQAGTTTSTATSGGTSLPASRQTLVLGVVLVAVGVILLAANTGLIQWSVIWPTVLIILGVVLLARTLDRRRSQ